MKIDLHVHTANSYDATGTPEEVLASARKAGLDGIAITEHDSYEKSLVFLNLAPHYNLSVFAGAEVALANGHFLVFSEDITRWNLYCETHQDPQVLINEVNSAGGAVIAAHPYRFGISYNAGTVAKLQGLAAIEVYNGGNRAGENRRAGELAEMMALPGTGGSDAHRIEEIGRCFTVFSVPVRTIGELVAALKAGCCTYGLGS